MNFLEKTLDKIIKMWYNKYVIKRAVALRNGDNENEKHQVV